MTHDGGHQCYTCDEAKPCDQFDACTYVLSRHPGWRCKPCRRVYTARWQREVGRFRKYGTTRERFEALLEAQGGRCAICRRLFGEDEQIVIDHDHRCCPERFRSCGKCIRGLLCHSCNRGIGLLGESPATLEAAVRYLAGRSDVQ